MFDHLVLAAAVTTKQLPSLGFREAIAVVAIIFGIVMTIVAIVITLLRSVFPDVVAKLFDWILPLVTLGLTGWLVSISGIGVAGLCALFIGSVSTAAAIGAAVSEQVNAAYVAVGLTIFYALIGTILGGIDLYDLTHCLNNGSLC
jgi:hypothetical protein